jgi:hypothetical protein
MQYLNTHDNLQKTKIVEHELFSLPIITRYNYKLSCFITFVL